MFKTLAGAACALVFAVAFSAASAATYNVSLFEGNPDDADDLFGDDIADFTGTFTTDGASPESLVVSFSATVDGSVFNSLIAQPGFQSVLIEPGPVFPAGYLLIVAFKAGETFGSPVVADFLQIVSTTTLDAPFIWAIPRCDTENVCGGGNIRGAATVTRVGGEEPAPIPLPAAGLLLPAALAGLWAVRRRKPAS